MKTFCLWLCLLGSFVVQPAAAVDYLGFDPSPTANVVYRLRIRTNTNSPTYPWTFDLGTNRIVGVTNGPWGVQSYSVVSVTTNGIESLPSNEVRGTNQPGAPVTLRLVSTGGLSILQGATDASGPWADLAHLTNPPVKLSTQQRQLFRLKINAPPFP